MKNRILKKITRLILLFIVVAIWCAYSYDVDTKSIYTSSTPVSRSKNRLGSKKSKRPCSARPSEKQM